MAPTLLFITGVLAGLIVGFVLSFPTSLLAILKGLAMTIQQTETAKNIGQIQAQAVELHLGIPARASQLWSQLWCASSVGRLICQKIRTYERPQALLRQVQSYLDRDANGQDCEELRGKQILHRAEEMLLVPTKTCSQLNTAQDSRKG